MLLLYNMTLVVLKIHWSIFNDKIQLFKYCLDRSMQFSWNHSIEFQDRDNQMPKCTSRLFRLEEFVSQITYTYKYIIVYCLAHYAKANKVLTFISELRVRFDNV